MQNKEYIEITIDVFQEMTPIFAQFIEMGRKGYRLDVPAEELAKRVVDWETKNMRKRVMKLVKGKKNG